MRPARFWGVNLLAAAPALLPFLGLLHSASAAVVFSSPPAGVAIAGLTLDVAWGDDGAVPLLTDLTDYKLYLCAGGNTGDAFKVVYQLTTTGSFTSGNIFSGVIPASVGAPVPNAYFLQMIATAKQGGTLTAYSTRFSIPLATGTFDSTLLAGIKAVGASAAGPQGINQVVGANQPGAAGDAAPPESFSLAWAQQTGLVRYAPMQMIPPSKITKKNPTPLNPTSAFVIAATFNPPPPAGQTTISQRQTASFDAKEATIAAQAMPTDHMQKFLNRWRD